jgi:P4 family phage/plasmid primase-like protien
VNLDKQICFCHHFKRNKTYLKIILQFIARSGILTTGVNMAKIPNFDNKNYRGRCAEIALALAPHCRNMIERRPKHGPCPKCDGRDRARCFDDFDETGGIICNQCAQTGCSDLMGFLSWANDWSRIKASREINKYINRVKGPQSSMKLNKNKNLTAHNSTNEKKNNQIWKEAKKDTGAIKKYLKFRGLSGLVPKCIRLHPNLPFYEISNEKIKDQGNFPAMISPITNGRELVGIHRTWINQDGKGKIPFHGSKKSGKIGSSISGGVIELFPIESGKPLIIAEGIETAIAVHEATGWPAWSCVTAINFQKIKFPRKVESICLGVDLDKSRTGEREAKKLAEKLHEEQRQVFLVVPSGPIPEDKKSIDWLDILNTNGDDEVKNAFYTADPWKPSEGVAAPTRQTETTDWGNDLKQAEVADMVFQKYDCLLIYCNHKFFHFSGAFWGNVTKGKLKNLITKIYGSKATGSNTSGALNVLQSKCYEEDHSPQRDYIGLLNGDLDPITSKIFEHSRNRFIFNQLSIKWEPTAKCKLWNRTLEEIFGDDKDSDQKVNLLQEWFGYCLIPDTSFHKFLWMVGSGANGKSLILRILTGVIGKENVSHVHLDRLEKGFIREMLRHKLVNISSEMNINANIAAGYLKSIVAGEPIDADGKNKDPISFLPYVRLVGATNELPPLKDFSEGFRRRAIILAFNRIFNTKEQDRHREKFLLEELPGILVWAVNGLKRLMKNNAFTIPTTSQDALDKYIHDSNPVQQFAHEKLKPDPNGKLTPENIFNYFRQWAEQNGQKMITKNLLGRRLRELGFEKRKSSGREFWKAKFRNEGKPKISRL